MATVSACVLGVGYWLLKRYFKDLDVVSESQPDVVLAVVWSAVLNFDDSHTTLNVQGFVQEISS